MIDSGTKNTSSRAESEASLSKSTENAMRIIDESQQTALHVSDIIAARNELGVLNLDYSEANRKMLVQAKKLQKRFG